MAEKDYLEEAPSNWKRNLVLPAVPKDGEPYEDEFELKLDKPVSYGSQLYTFASPLKVKVEACRSEGRVLTDISVSGAASVPCSRCLEPAGVAINGNLRYLFSLRPDEPHEKDEAQQDGEEDVILLDSWEDEIALGPLVWEVLLTSLPSVVLCSEDCKGLCPVCGTNLNKSQCSCKVSGGDPRFEVLRSFSKKNLEK